jgi:hypothetical protein
VEELGVKPQAIMAIRYSAIASILAFGAYLAPDLVEYEGRRDLFGLLLLWLTVSVPCLYILFRMRGDGDPRGIAMAMAWGGTLVIPLALVFAIALVFFLAGEDSVLITLPLAGLALPPALLYYSGRKLWRSEPRRAPLSPKYSPTYWRVFAVFAILATTSMYVRGSFDMAGNETAAINAIRKLNQCSGQFAARHLQQGYPLTLGQLGPGGEQCISSKLARGLGRFYEFEYRAGTPDAAGRVNEYVILARPSSLEKRWRRFLSNQSGVIHSTADERDATPQDPVLP